MRAISGRVFLMISSLTFSWAIYAHYLKARNFWAGDWSLWLLWGAIILFLLSDIFICLSKDVFSAMHSYWAYMKALALSIIFASLFMPAMNWWAFLEATWGTPQAVDGILRPEPFFAFPQDWLLGLALVAFALALVILSFNFRNLVKNVAALLKIPPALMAIFAGLGFFISFIKGFILFFQDGMGLNSSWNFTTFKEAAFKLVFPLVLFAVSALLAKLFSMAQNKS